VDGRGGTLAAVIRGVLNGLQGCPLLPGRLRRIVLRALNVTVRPGAYAWHSVYFAGHSELGENAFINGFCYVDQQVTIGRNVRIGSHAKFVTSDHEIGPSSQRCIPTVTTRPVRIGDGCWIGTGAIILPGVHVAEGCVVGAGAVVTRSTEPDGLYLGAPARRVRDLAP
jgi:maltose O-acetyltransferase